MVDVGRAVIRVSAELDRSSLSNLERGGRDGLIRAGRSMARAGRTMTSFITLPIVGAGAAVLKMSADFESSMNRVAAITGATGDDFDSLRSQAQDLGATTAFSASEAAEAMTFLGMAGFETNEIMSAMPGTLNLAAASGIELADSADIMSNVLTGMGLAAEEADRAVDVMAKTTSSANTDMTQLGSAMSFVAPVAASAGVSLEETAAAIGLLGNAGIQGTRAGTTLRGAITRLLNPSAQAASAMEALGISAVDSSGELRPLDNIISQLADSGATTADFMTIFGQRAGPGMAALVDQGANALTGLTSDLEESGGTAQEMADKQLEGLNGALQILKSSAEALAIAIGDTGLLESFTGLVQGFTGFVQNLSQSNPQLLRLGVIIAGIAAAAGPLLIVVGALVTAIGAIGLPVLAAVAAVGALGAALFALRDQIDFGAIVTSIQDAFSRIQPILSAIGSAFLDMIQGLAPVAAGFADLFEAWAPALRVVIPAALAVVAAIGALGPVVAATAAFVAGRIIGVLLPPLLRLGAFVGDQLAPVFEALAEVFTTQVVPAVQAVIAQFVAWWPTIRPVVIALGALAAGVAAIAFVVPAIVVALTTFGVIIASRVLPPLIRLGGFLVSGLAPAFRVVQAIFQAAPAVFNAVVTAVTAVGSAFRGVARTVAQFIQRFTLIGLIAGIAVETFSQVGRVVTRHMRVVARVVRRVARVVQQVISRAWGVVASVTSRVWGALSGPVTAAIGAITGAVRRGTSAVRSAVSTAFGALRGIVSRAWGRVRDAVQTGVSNAVSAARDIGSRIRLAVSGINLYEAGRALIASLVSGISSRIGDAIDVVRDGLGKIRNLLPSSPIREGPLLGWNNGGAGKRLMDLLALGIDEGAEDVERAMNRALGGVGSPSLPGAPGTGAAAPRQTGSVAGVAAAEAAGDERAPFTYAPVFNGPTTGRERLSEMEWALRFATDAVEAMGVPA